MLKFRLHAVPLVKRGHPLSATPPHLQQIAYTSGGETGRGRSGYEGEGRKGEEPKLPMATEKKRRRKEKESARPATAVHTARLFCRLSPAPKLERQLHAARLEVLRGSRSGVEVRRTAGSPHLLAGGAGTPASRPLEAAGGTPNPGVVL